MCAVRPAPASGLRSALVGVKLVWGGVGYCASVGARHEGFLLCLERLHRLLPGGASFRVWNHIISVHDKAENAI